MELVKQVYLDLNVFKEMFISPIHSYEWQSSNSHSCYMAEIHQIRILDYRLRFIENTVHTCHYEKDCSI